jgi:hypothetical protein
MLTADVIKAGMQYIEESGWAAFHPFTLVINGCLLSPLPFASREDFLNQALLTWEQMVVEETTPLDPELTPQERLFEVFFTRFDMLNPYKKTLQHIWEQWIDLPGSLSLCLREWLASINRLRTYASGLIPRSCSYLQAPAFIFCYLKAQHTWFHDDTPDLAPTMAALDHNIHHYLKIVEYIGI